jgi:hypothetical protein
VKSWLEEWFVALLVWALPCAVSEQALDDDDDSKQKADRFTRDFLVVGLFFLTEGSNPYFYSRTRLSTGIRGEEDGEGLVL